MAEDDPKGGDGGRKPAEPDGRTPPSSSSVDPRAPKGETGHKIERTPLEREMKRSYIDYSMSVIVGRALPDARDGLKPVHRRILHTMNELGLSHSKAYKKSVRVVGDVLGKYHPHGDTAVYEALVRMAQDFSLRYLLVEGQGNFGSIDGDSAAAMRYTECRMANISEEMLADIDSNTVDMVDNFDGSFKEPTVLPSRIPNLLVNGSSGIAVGMSTNIPPHNMNEVVDGIVRFLDDKSAGRDTTVEDLMEVVKGPDFPTGGIIYGAGGVRSYISTGRGKVRVRAKTHFEEVNDQKTRIIVTEIPYQVNKTTLLENIASLVREKKIDGITNVNDESDREGMRIVIDLRRDAVPELVLTQLFKHTELQTTFGIIMLALIDNQPRILDLREAVQVYVDHRFKVIRRRSQFLLDKAQARLHILEGLLIALDNLDEVLKLIRKSKTGEDAENSLMSRFLLSQEQAKAILAMRLSKLTGLESDAIRAEAKQVKLEIDDLEDILLKDDRVIAIIRADLLEVKEKYGDARRTEIIAETSDIEEEDLIPREMVVVTITDSDYIKRLPLDTYKSQRRGGKGLIGMETKEEDNIKDLFVTHSHDYVLCFTNRGRVFWLKAYRIPEGGRHAKGKPIINLLPRLEKDERVHQMIPVHEFSSERYLIFATRKGKIKKTVLSAYSRPMVSGIWAIKLTDDDELIEARITDGLGEIVLASRNGQATRFSDRDIRPMGRHTQGVIGMRLRDGDEVVSMAAVPSSDVPDGPTPEGVPADDAEEADEDAVEEEDELDEDDQEEAPVSASGKVLLTLTELGYGKRSPVSSYRKTRRGGRGVRTIKTSDRNGKVVKVIEVSEDDELIITSTEGMVIRLPVSDIRLIGRMTSGVRIMRLEGKDKIVAVARLVTDKVTDRVLEDAGRIPVRDRESDPSLPSEEKGAEGE